MAHPLTIEQTRRNIENGHGTGHYDRYHAWLDISRKNSSKKSNQIVGKLPGYRRKGYFFSRVEYYIALLCLWLGALDVREQFPMWPMAHPHPLADGVVDWRLPEIPGLFAIAEEAGIRHGTVVGTGDVPYIASMDLMPTIEIDGKTRLAGISLKPYDMVTQAEPTDRLLERHELERRYMVTLDEHFVIADDSLVPKVLRGNLEMLAAHKDEIRIDDAQTEDLLGWVMMVAGDLPFSAAVRCAATAANLPGPDAFRRVYSAIWHQDVDIDPTKPIRADLPLSIGAKSIRALLQRELFGAAL